MKNGMIVAGDGVKSWWVNDELHREDGPAEEYADGSKYWRINNKLHRVDGPAIVWGNGNKYWLQNGIRHREDGPAIERTDGSKEWFLYGKELIQPKEFATMEKWLLELNTNEEYSYQYINDIEGLIGFIDNPSPRQKRLHQMKWVL